MDSGVDVRHGTYRRVRGLVNLEGDTAEEEAQGADISNCHL